MKKVEVSLDVRVRKRVNLEFSSCGNDGQMMIRIKEIEGGREINLSDLIESMSDRHLEKIQQKLRDED